MDPELKRLLDQGEMLRIFRDHLLWDQPRSMDWLTSDYRTIATAHGLQVVYVRLDTVNYFDYVKLADSYRVAGDELVIVRFPTGMQYWSWRDVGMLWRWRRRHTVPILASVYDPAVPHRFIERMGLLQTHDTGGTRGLKQQIRRFFRE